MSRDLDPEELKVLENVIFHFANYRNTCLTLPKIKKIQAKRLKTEFLDDYFRLLDTVQDRIIRNSIFLREIVKDLPFKEVDCSFSSMDKIRTVLRQFTRDWSLQGLQERNQNYTPIIKELQSLYSNYSKSEKERVKVLVPGAGLARLAHDIAQNGYQVQGNEFSFYMLLSSDFILNKCGQQVWEIYPWIHSFSNMPSTMEIVQGVLIPDTNVGQGINPDRFSMVAGDFLQVYSHKDQEKMWDVVVTCFFIDTATDIRKYIDIIYQVLKDGGTWINLGPLLYHFEDSKEDSIELPLDQVMRIIRRRGFEIIREEFRNCTYTNCPDSLMTYTYKCVFFTAKKINDDQDV